MIGSHSMAIKLTNTAIACSMSMGKSHTPKQLKSGTDVGHNIKVGDLIGTGTFANVYNCARGNRPKQLALKTVRKRDLGPFECEILNLISSNQSENYYCMKLLKQFRYNKLYCLLMPIYGPSCLDLIENTNYQGLHISRVRDIALGVFSGLEFLSRFDIIHTDIKPENVVLMRNGDYRHPIIIDFGSAVYDNGKNHGKATTEAYRAPEVEVGSQPVHGQTLPIYWTRAIDVWATGCLLYELWKGTQLFEKDPELNLIYLICDVVGTPPYYIPARQTKVHVTMNLKDVPCDSAAEITLLNLIAQCLTLDHKNDRAPQIFSRN
jgi:dual-specificity kinase